MAFIEVKKPNNHDGILAERDRINKRMRNKSFHRFINLTQLMIFSNNQEYDNENRVPIQGAFYCCASKEKAFFNVFREADATFVPEHPYITLTEEVEKQVLKHRNCVVIKNLPDYETNKKTDTPTNRVLTSMLCQERFLFLLRYGFAYVNKNIELEDGSKVSTLEKHVMRYQQLFASLAIRKKLARGVKSGIIWHTQGSGKTALAYYSVRSLNDFYAKRDTAVKFYFIVDRIALMEQASDEFAARGLVVRTANSRDDLMNDIRERCEKVQAEFDANFDKNEEKYVILADEFRVYFRKKGFVPQSTQDAKESIDYMDNVMKKIREINRRNNLLKKKYKGDERFVRIHKRIEEENQKRGQPIISAHEYEIAENLSQMKSQIDNMLFLNINILDNEDAFKRDILAIVGHKLIDLGIKADLTDRKYINNLITTEYFQQRNFVY